MGQRLERRLFGGNIGSCYRSLSTLSQQFVTASLCNLAGETWTFTRDSTKSIVKLIRKSTGGR